MYSDVNPLKAFEIIETSNVDVMCDGGGGALGHPRVFLHINPDLGEIACPYCSREFKLVGDGGHSH